MKAKKQEKIEDFVMSINKVLKIDPASEDTRKLEKQIRTIAKKLVKDINKVLKRKISKEEKLLAHELKNQKKQNRILAAQQILKGEIFVSKAG